MISARYRFVRLLNVAGFLSRNRVSTDSVRALELWRQSGSRSYEVVEEDDDWLIADLVFDPTDPRVGSVLEDLCDRCGIERIFLKTNSRRSGAIVS